MMPRLSMLVAGLCCAISGLAPAWHLHAATEQHWDFTVYLDQREIGAHRFTVTDSGDIRNVDIHADLRVRILFLTVYTYRHDNREQWSNGCIEHINAVTDDNGTEYRVSGQRDSKGFLLETGDGEQRLTGCVRSFAYWDPRILEGGKLLNSQTGEHVEVHVEHLGADPIPVRGMIRDAHRYRLTSDEVEIDLWYSPQREWLALESTTTDGAHLRYRIE